MKLTPAKKKALVWFAENSPSKWWPNDFSLTTIKRLETDGMISREAPRYGFGMIRYSITEAGRRALDEVQG